VSQLSSKKAGDSLPHTWFESITFSELNDEDEGKVTSMDKRRWPGLCFYYVRHLTTLSHTKLNGVSCYVMRR
jgi:hypothetical protein